MKRVFTLLVFVTALPLFPHDFLLAGTQNGLYTLTPSSVRHIWTEAPVRKILQSGSNWWFLTGKGVIASHDLVTFSEKNTGLPIKVIKKITNGEKSFVKQIQMLKDLEVHPQKSEVLVTATNDEVFISENAGLSWKSIGASSRVNGIKAVCITDMPDAQGVTRQTVFMSHAIYGFAWKQPAVSDKWHSLNDGLVSGPESDEEISDIVIRTYRNSTEIYVSQTFTSKIYLLNWKAKRFEEVPDSTGVLTDAPCIDGLAAVPDSLIGCKDGTLFSFPLMLPFPQQNRLKEVMLSLRRISGTTLSAWVPKSMTHLHSAVSLSELWLLDNTSGQRRTEYMRHASGRKGVYMPAHQGKTAAGLQRYFDLLEKNKLDMLIVDMKDDFGFVRYDSQDPVVTAVGAVRPFFQLEDFTAKAKERNIYLVARIVSFKDKQLYKYQNNRYAIQNKGGGPWQGYTTADGKKALIEEHWVDPYNEHVWEYVTAIAAELIDRGFDEIQFDYIRFPTDGDNLGAAVYPAREKGMDKESALMSFLSYARGNIRGPISIDIYGANGWYRTGARTGQEVELLAEYVDVICPMFYPSHFRQSFLAQPPAQERPYRIYYQGTYRNKIIARNRAIIRPWAQAFYIPVSYDKKFYDADYVQRQILGIKDSVDEGYAYWNNSGRYEDIRPDGLPLPD